MLHKATIAAALMLTALAAVLFLATPDALAKRKADAGMQTPLAVIPLQGAAPLDVRIDGPAELMQMIETCTYRFGFITPAFSIEWGDGTRSSPQAKTGAQTGKSCADAGTHTYTVPGTYTVLAQRWHLGPTDAPILDWEGTAQITVDGTAGPTRVRILSPKPGENFGYQGLPVLEWALQAGAPVDITLELLDSAGNVLSRDMRTNNAFSGTERSNLSQTDPVYDEALRAKRTPFALRIRALKGQDVVAEDTVGDIKVSAEMLSAARQIAVTPADGAAPLTVTLSYPYWHKDCFSYEIDWGDGTPKVSHILPVQEQCALKGDTLTLTHTYEKTGTYDVILRSNNIYTFMPLDRIVPYERARVNVR